MTVIRIVILTSLALIAFASNSLLCRVALGNGLIDAASFSSLRILSGAAALVLLVTVSRRGRSGLGGGWGSGLVLFLYAVPFSFAYLSLSVGTGALILFTSVQATMMATAVISGERPGLWEWIGFVAALGGLFYLVAPGMEAPPLLGVILMAIAGVAWGIYSLGGHGSADPLLETAGNFVYAIPFAFAVSAASYMSFEVTSKGVLLAVVSGALASGLGYVLWYGALRGLTSAQASAVQLLAPVLATLGGVVFLGELLTIRIVFASILIVGGVLLAIAGRRKRRAL